MKFPAVSNNIQTYKLVRFIHYQIHCLDSWPIQVDTSSLTISVLVFQVFCFIIVQIDELFSALDCLPFFVDTAISCFYNFLFTLKIFRLCSLCCFDGVNMYIWPLTPQRNFICAVCILVSYLTSISGCLFCHVYNFSCDSVFAFPFLIVICI